MKTIFKLMTLFLLFVGFTACSDDDEPVVEQLEVTPANLNGTWKLVEWNGEALSDDCYCYITFSRKDRTYKMYDKFSSMYPTLKTGSFDITVERNLGYVISGNYDFGNGTWANKYIVSDLLATVTMVWTVKDNANDVQKFERCDKVPSEIVDEARPYSLQ